MFRTLVPILLSLLLAGCSIFLGSRELALSPQSVTPMDHFDHRPFVALLDTYVDEQGFVRYQAWHDNRKDRAALDSYLTQVAHFSPESHPALFTGRSERLAYWVNAYNAWVIKGVLENWPLESVNDVKARLEVVRGAGFFYTLKIQVGGETTSLYELERNKILKNIEEPRLHFVLNCASDSCPPLRPIPPASADMETTLQQATEDFLLREDSLTIDHQARLVRLSEIFDWYREDFIKGARLYGLDFDSDDQAMIRYLARVAPKALQPELQKADDYQLAYFDYNWSINQSQTDTGAQELSP